MTRSPFAAFVLSLLAPGTGQIWCGELARGLTLFLLPLVLSGFVLGHAALGAPLGVVPGFVVPETLVLGLYAFAAIDAVLATRRVGRPESGRSCT